MLSKAFSYVFDISSIGQIPNPLAQTMDGIDMNNTNTPFISQQINPIDGYESPHLQSVEPSPTDAAPIHGEIVDVVQMERMELPETHISNVEPQLEGADSDAPLPPSFIDQCVQEIDPIIESTPPLANSQPNAMIAVESGPFDLISCPFGAPRPESNMPNHFEGPHPVIPHSSILGAALHDLQSLLFDDNEDKLLPLVPELADNNSPFPSNSAPPFVEQVASTFAAVGQGPLFRASTSPMAMQAPGHAKRAPNRATQPHSPRAADFRGHAPLSVGDACQQEGKPISPSRFCHICVRPRSRFRFLLCLNISTGTCRKVVRKRCLQDFNRDWHAAANNPSWACSHCAGTCPERASCFTYNKWNKKRKTRRPSGAQNKRSRKT